MGVAVRVRVSILLLIWRIFSLEETPNFCSSSMMSNPRSLKSTFLLRMRWVPIRISTLPAWSSSNMRDISLVLRRRLIYSTLQGKSFRREEKVWKCCSARMVVGTNTATCLLSQTALNAALMATSVLPNPTSPHTRRSIGRSLSISSFTFFEARAWSGVSSYINEDSSSCIR